MALYKFRIIIIIINDVLRHDNLSNNYFCVLKLLNTIEILF